MDFFSNLDSRSLDKETPTIFEVISSNQLEQLLSPSVRFLLVHYTQRYPRYLLRILNRFDELNLLVRGIIEYRTLQNWNSTFTEKFYGLKRINSLRLQNSEATKFVVGDKIESMRRLKKIQIIACLFELLMIPYIKEKLDVLYDKLYPKLLLNQLRSDDPDVKNRLRYYFLKLYPRLSLILKLLNIFTQVLFLSGNFKSPSLISWLFKIGYSRMNQYDYNLDELRKDAFLGIKKNNDSNTGSSLDPQSSRRIRPITLRESLSNSCNTSLIPLKQFWLLSSNTIFPVSIFLLKFLEWWNSSDFAAQLQKKSQSNSSIQDTDLPKPKFLSTELLTGLPKSSIRKLNDMTSGNYSNCPICNEEIHNPAIIETGYVFCYTCIYKYLTDGDSENGGRCPISGKRLLGCHYSHSNKSWKVKGIRKLMI